MLLLQDYTLRNENARSMMFILIFITICCMPLESFYNSSIDGMRATNKLLQEVHVCRDDRFF